jgi:hypothetical protein
MTAKSLRDQIRAATVGSKNTFKSEKVTLNGIDIDVRQISIKARDMYVESALQKDQSVDLLKLKINAIIASCYVPGTEDLVYEDTDFDLISQSVTGGYADKIWVAIQKMSNLTIDDVKKN